MAKKHIKFWSLLLALVMVMSLLPMSALAEEATSYSNKEKAKNDTSVEANKVAADNGNGTYTVTLSTKGVTETGSETQNLPADVVLVIDSSGSMDFCGSTNFTKYEGNNGKIAYKCDVCGKIYNYNKVPDYCTNEKSVADRMSNAQAAATSFVTGLIGSNSEIKVGLCDFSGYSYSDYSYPELYSGNHVRVELGGDSTALTTAINSLDKTHSDGTSYTAGLNEAKSILDKGTNDQKFIVFLSDGEPNSGDGTDLAKKLIDSGVTIFTIGIDVATDKMANALKAITSVNASNQPYYYPAASNALTDVLNTLKETITTMTYSGKNAVMTDVVNTADFDVVDTPSGDGVTYNNGTIKWNIGEIGSIEKTLSFTVKPKDGKYGTLHTNSDVSLTFDSTKLGKEVTLYKSGHRRPDCRDCPTYTQADDQICVRRWH